VIQTGVQYMSKIGIDLGTTNIKAVLFDDNYQEIENISTPIQTMYNGDFAEQDIQEIVDVVFSSIERLNNKDVSHISFSSAMHSIILSSSDLCPFTKNVIWLDNRSKDLINNFKEQADWLSFYHKTGTPIHTMSPFAKLLWYKENTSFINKDIRVFGIKEYIIFKLTGEFVEDYSIASATGLMNIHTLKWDKDILDYIGINEEQLPRLVDTNQTFSALNYSFKVVVGASDGCLVNIGVGALSKGQTTLTLGTSGAVRMTVYEPVLDPHGRTFCYYIKKNTYVIGGAVNNGGNVLTWLGRVFYNSKEEMFDDLPHLLERTKEGSNGLVFFPFLFGERAPFWDANLTACFVGLTHNHTRDDMVRAVIESVLFNLKHVLEILESNSCKSNELYISGGVLQNLDILDLLAGIFKIKIHIQDSYEAAAIGAVLLNEEKDISFNQESFYTANHIYNYDNAYKNYRDTMLKCNLED
jgi:gluconokinase